MHYIDEGEGPVVVLLHGWPESRYSWRHQISFLADAGYRVIAPDQRGYGDTEVSSEVGSYHILNLVGDVVGLLNALDVRSAALVGHDWGSMVAAAAALLRPDLFHRICLRSVPYMPRRNLRPSTRFQPATQGKYFYQDYYQRVGIVEKELAEDTHRSILGALYAGSGEARRHAEHSRASFIAFDKSTRFVDIGPVRNFVFGHQMLLRCLPCLAKRLRPKRPRMICLRFRRSWSSNSSKVR